MQYKTILHIICIVYHHSDVIELVLVLVQVHLDLLVLLGHRLVGHVVDQLVHVTVLDLLFLRVHDVLHILVHHRHALLLSHEPFHGLLHALVLHLVARRAHDLGHPAHDILHGLVDCHLLQLKGQVLQLPVELVVLVYHLIVLEDLLGDHLFCLRGLLLLDLLLEIAVEVLALVL